MLDVTSSGSVAVRRGSKQGTGAVGSSQSAGHLSQQNFLLVRVQRVDHAIRLVFEMLSKGPKGASCKDSCFRVSITDTNHDRLLQRSHVLLQRM